MKSFLRCCVTVGLIAFFLLPAILAQSRFYRGVELDKLGLTADQRSKTEAILKNADEQRSAILDQMPKPGSGAGSAGAVDYKIARKQRIAKQRQINDHEEMQLRVVLTIAQWQRLKDMVYPKNEWGVSGYIFADKDLVHLKVRLDSYPPRKYLSYVIHKSGIQFSVLDYAGKPVANGPKLTLASTVPDLIKPVEDDEGEDSAWVDLLLDRKSAQPGYYRLLLTAPVDATDPETEQPIKLIDATARSGGVYITPQPDTEPALTPGQRFIGTPWVDSSGATSTAYKDAKTGKPIYWREIATRIATLQRVEPSENGNKLTFVLEGHSGQIVIETQAQATDLPYLTALLAEPTVRNLKAHYEGKQVWCYGGAGGTCVSAELGMSSGMRGKITVPLRIRHVERAYLPLRELAIGNATFIGGERQSGFVTDNPLVVILDAPRKGLEFGGFIYVGNKSIEQVQMGSLGLWNMVSDRWDFEREYSLQSPLVIGKKWPAKMRKAVLDGKVVKGMTREMVAWVMGWPNIYGTKQDMLKLSDWTYDNIPHDGHIYFKNGLMTSQDWPRLP